MTENIDKKVVEGFGDEWSRFDQSALTHEELTKMFDNYFNIFPWEKVSKDAVGFDLGCGSGRWAKMFAPRVGKLHLIDPSDALEVAKRNLRNSDNCEFHRATVEEIPLADDSQDFGYCLGVLHHIPDTKVDSGSALINLKKMRRFWFTFIIVLIIVQPGFARFGNHLMSFARLSANCLTICVLA